MDQNNKHIHLRISALCLTTLGFWPWQFKNKFLGLLYRTYYRITLSFYVMIVCSQFVEMYVTIQQGLLEVSFLIGIFLLYSLGLVKVWVLESDSVKRLTRKIQVTEQNIVQCDNDEVKRIFWECIKQNKAINVFVIAIAWVCNSMFVVMPYLSEVSDPPTILFDVIDNTTIVYRPRPLPLPVWVPFDRYKYYKTTYAWHILISFIVPSYLLSLDNFFFSIIIFATGQIKILQHNFFTITEGIEDVKHKDVVISNNLMKCAEYHKTIIRFVEELSNAMSTFLMLDFAACGLQIAVIAFQVAMGKLEFQMMTTVTYFITMLVQLFLFYWFGNEILLESLNVAKAIWESEWYLCNASIKRTLLVIMMRAQKPLTLSIGPFYSVSTSSMMAVIRTGYSYAAVMRRLYSDK